MMETVLNEESVVQLLADLVKIKSPYFEEDEVMAYANEGLNANEVPSTSSDTTRTRSHISMVKM